MIGYKIRAKNWLVNSSAMLAFTIVLSACGGQQKPFDHPNDPVLLGAVLPSKAEVAASPQPLLFGGATSLANVDLSTTSALPPIGDQLHVSSCVAWACGYGLASFEAAQAASVAADSPSRWASAADLFAKTITASGLGCNPHGTSADVAMNILMNSGVASEQEVPYTQNCIMGSNLHTFRINGIHRFAATDSTAIKTMLSQNHVVAIGLNTFSDLSWFGYTNHGDEVYVGNGQRDGNGHMMLIVGYSDAKQAWKVMNSWGTSWGNNGFFWLSYQTFASAGQCAYVADSGGMIQDPNTDMSGTVSITNVQSLQYRSFSSGAYYLVLPFQLSAPFYVQFARMKFEGNNSTTQWFPVNQWTTANYMWWGLYTPFPFGNYGIELQGQNSSGQSQTIYASAPLQNAGWVRSGQSETVDASPDTLRKLEQTRQSSRSPGDLAQLNPGDKIMFNGHIATLQR